MPTFKKQHFFELEPRIMFDAAGAAVVEANAEGTHTVDSTETSDQNVSPIVAMYSETIQKTAEKVEQSYQDALVSISSFLQKEGSADKMAEVFALESGVKALEGFDILRDQVLSGNYAITLQILDAETMGVAKAAYAAEGPDGDPVIYINGDWAAEVENDELQHMMIEEIGHHFDTLLHGSADSVGDEGERFAALISGTLAGSTGMDNDHYTMTIDGQKLEVELASFNFVNAYEMVYDLNNNGSIVGSTGETAATKEQNSHNFNPASLGPVTIDDNNYNSSYFSGNDVSAIGLNIAGQTYYGWVSRPIKAGGIIRGFYFWTDNDFTDLATAQADGNMDADGNITDNKGYLLVVDQAWFNSQISSTSTTIATNIDGNASLHTYANVGSSSDRVDSSLNSLVTANTAPTATNDTADGSNGTTAAVEAGYNVATVNGAGNVLINDSDANSDSLRVTHIGTSNTQLTSVSTGTTSVNGSSVTGRYGTLTIGSNGTYSYVVDNTNATVDALQTGFSLNETFNYTISDGKGATATATLTIVIKGTNDAPVANSDYNSAKETITTPSAYTGFSATGDVTLNDTDVDDSESTKTIVGLSITGEATAGSVSVMAGTTNLSFIGDNGFTSVGTNQKLYVNIGGTYRAVYTSDQTTQVSVSSKLESPSGSNNWVITLTGTPGYYYDAAGKVAITSVSTFFSTNTAVGFENSTNITENTAGMKTATVAAAATTGSTTLSNLSGISGTIAVGMDVTGTGVPSGTKVSEINYTSGILTSIKLDKELTSTSGGAFTFSKIGSASQTLTGAHGSLTLNANGTYTYTPITDNPLLSSGQSALEVFDYTMQDSQGVQSSSKLYITVYGTGTNDPVLANDTGTAKETGVQPNSNSAETGSNATGNVLANDTSGAGGIVTTFSKADGSGSVSAGSSIIGAYGSLTIASDGTYTYTVDNSNSAVNTMLAGQSLSEIFIYKVTNTANGMSYAKLTITINGTNDQIVAVNNTAAVQEDVILNTFGNVVTNDTDIDSGDTKTVSKAGTSSANTAVTVGATSVSNGLAVTGTYGILTIGADGTYRYVLDNASATVQNLTNGQIVYDTFTYEVKDTNGSTSTATLTVTVTGSNEPPINSYPATVTTNVNDPISFTGSNIISVADTDTTGTTNSVILNVDHGVLTFASAPSNVTLVGDGTGGLRITGTLTDINAALALLKYTPTTDFYGIDYLTIMSQDTNNGNDSDSIAITVNKPASFSGADTASVTEDSGNYVKTGGVIVTDPDSETTLVAQTNVSGTYGTFSIDVDGNWTYIANNTLLQPLKTTAAATDTFTITAADGTTHTITITLNGVNEAPINTVPSSQTTNEDTALVFSSANSNLISIADSDSTTLTTTLSIPSGKGTLSVASGSGATILNDGTNTVQITGTVAQINSALNGLIYTPSANANGASYTTLTISTSDTIASDTDTVIINVTPVNDPPVATQFTKSLQTLGSVAFNTLQPTYTDIDSDIATQTTAIKIVGLPSSGVIEYSADGSTGWSAISSDTIMSVADLSKYRYVAPATGGNYDFTWQVQVDGQWSNTATGTFVVTAGADNAPTLTLSTSETITSGVLDSSTGIIQINEDSSGHVTLALSDDYTAVGALTVQVSSGTSSLIDSTGISIGALSGTDRAITFTPKADMYGSSLITITISDGNSTVTKTFTLEVVKQNDIPLGEDFLRQLNEDETFYFNTIDPTSIYNDSHDVNKDVEHPNVTDSTFYNTQMGIIQTNMGYLQDADISNDSSAQTTIQSAVTALVEANYFPMQFVIETLPSDGKIYLGATEITTTGYVVPIEALATLTYRPNTNFNGTDSFLWHGVDVDGGFTASKTATFTVNPINDAPTAGNDTLVTNEDIAKTQTLPSATDIDGDSVTYAKATDPSHGTVSVNANGTYTYTPAANYHGSDSFTYTVSDGHGGVNTYTVNITVNPINDLNQAPTAGNDSLVTNEGSTKTQTLPSATDIDGDSVTYAKATDPSHGTVSVNANGTYTYTPAANYHGSDSFTYTVSDGYGGVNTYTVNITVNAIKQSTIPDAIPNLQPALSEPIQNSQNQLVEIDMIITKTLDKLQEQSDAVTAVLKPQYADKPYEAPSRIENLKEIQVNTQGRIVLEFAGQYETTQMQGVEVKAFQMDPTFVRVVVKDTQYKDGDAKFEMFALDGTVAPEWLQIDPITGLITGIPPKGIEKVVVQVKILGKDGKIKTVDVEINVMKKNIASIEGTLSQRMNHFTSEYRSSDELISILNKTAKGA
jgi:VCBS repeat-containing protein